MMHIDSSPPSQAVHHRYDHNSNHRSATLPRGVFFSNASAGSPRIVALEETELIIANEQIHLLREANKRLQQQLHEGEAQLAEYRAEVRRHLEASTSAALLVNQLKAKVRDSIPVADYETLHKEKETLEASLSACKEGEASLLSERGQLEKQIRSLQDENIDIQQRNDALKGAIDKYKGDTQAFESMVLEYSDLQAELESTKEELSKTQETVGELRREVELYQSEPRRRPRHLNISDLGPVDGLVLGSRASLLSNSTNFSTTSISTLTHGPSTGGFPRTGQVVRANSLATAATASGAAESMAVVQTRELELQLEEAKRTIEQLASEKGQLTSETLQSQQRIKSLQSELADLTKQLKHRPTPAPAPTSPQIKYIFLEKATQNKMNQSNDENEFNNESKDDQKESKDEQETEVESSESQTILEEKIALNDSNNNSGALNPKKAPKEAKKPKKHWYRFFICTTAITSD